MSDLTYKILTDMTKEELIEYCQVLLDKQYEGFPLEEGDYYEIT